jgi:hypothetical protein
VGGYNVALSLVNLAPADPRSIGELAVQLDTGPGLGLGFPPAEPVDLVLRTINGVGPDDHGNLILGARDCLRVFTPVLDNVPLAHTQQLDTDCSVCCSCSDYQAISDQIAASSAQIHTLCLQLAAAQADAVQAFTLGQNYIAARTSLDNASPVICRDPVLYGNILIFTVQNRAPYPLYAYVALNAGSLPSSSFVLLAPTSAMIVATAGAMADQVATDLPSLPPLATAVGGSVLFPMNLVEIGGGALIRVGYPLRGDGILHPLPAGGSCLVQIKLGDSADPLNAGDPVQWRTVGRFGASLHFGTLGHFLSSVVDTSLGTKTLKVLN